MDSINVSKQYRVTKHNNGQGVKYTVHVTYGLMDTKWLGEYQNREDAKKRCLQHAAANGWKAMILYSFM